MERIALFGSTGSVGSKVLEVVRMFPDKFSVKALGVKENISKVLEQAKHFNPKYLYVNNLVDRNIDSYTVLSGYEGIKKICSDEEIDTIIVAVDSYFGVFPVFEAIKNKKKVLTANKESIFMWGYEIMKFARENEVDIIPLDSEHSTILNLISRVGKENISKYIITASGGPFLNKQIEDLGDVVFSDVMEHPNWKMGKIVTFNSATMFNKFLEVFEAHIFFGIDIKDIEVVIHPESRVHSMVLLNDGTVWFVYYKPDMLFPVASAMFYPEVPPLILRGVDYEIPVEKTLNFFKLDVNKFPIMSLLGDIQNSSRAKRVLLNLANEVCISLFEEGKIKFSQIPNILIRCFKEVSINKNFEVLENLETEIKETKEWIRSFILDMQ